MTPILRFVGAEEGAAPIESAIVLALIALACHGAIHMVGFLNHAGSSAVAR
jgi:Flp pilus assembly pilin Flp